MALLVVVLYTSARKYICLVSLFTLLAVDFKQLSVKHLKNPFPPRVSFSIAYIPGCKLYEFAKAGRIIYHELKRLENRNLLPY